MDSATYIFGCPHCRRDIPVTPGHVGTALDCPNCGRKLTVPPPTGLTAGGRNPLLIPLVGVTVLLLGAIGYVLSGGRPEPTQPVAVAVATPEVTPVIVPKATPPPAEQAPPPPPKPLEPNGFDQVAAHLDRGGSFYLYMDTAQWLSGLSQQIESLREVALSSLPKSPDPSDQDIAKQGFGVLTDLVKNSGVEQVSGFGVSSLAVEKGIYVNKIFVHQAEAKTEGFIWSAFGKAPHHFDALDFLPADTAMASFSDLDLSHLLDGIRDEVAKSGFPNAGMILDASLTQFSTTFGMSLDDLFKSLGGSAGIVVTLDPAKPVSLPAEGQTLTIPTPRVAIFIRVKDDKIFAQIDKSMASEPGITHQDDAEVRMRVIPVPLPTAPWLHPTVAQWTKGYLILATDDSIVRDMIAAQKTGQGFKSTPQFFKLTDGLPQEGNSFQIVTEQFGEMWKTVQGEFLKAQPGATPEQSAWMQKMFAAQSPQTVCTISSHLPDGWLMVGRGTLGAGNMVGPMLVAPAAIVAGMALPAMGQSQDKAKSTKSMSNAKQIATACKLYAIDNDGKFPPNLKVLVPDYLADASIFASPYQPDVPVGYDYTPGLTDTSLATLVVLEDKFAPKMGHVRVVVHVDTSAEVLPLPQPAVK